MFPIKEDEEHYLECWERSPSGKVTFKRIKQTKEESDKWFKDLKEWVVNGKSK